jgi:hypothetical protein
MKNISRRIFLITIISFLVIPQVTFASWWNPFSWNIWNLFNRQNSETQVLENVTKEQQQNPKDNNATTTTNTSIKNNEDNKAKLEAEKKMLNAQSEALRVAKEQLQQQQIEITKQAEQKRQEELKNQAIEQEAVQSEKQNILPEEPKSTTINVGKVVCSWGGSDTVYTLQFSINGSWSSGYITVRSDDGIVRTGGLLYKSDFERDGGYVFGSKSGLKRSLSQKYSYEISLYSEGPYFHNVGIQNTPYFPSSSLLDEESGVFELPSC